MRALLAVVIGMGVLIVVGVAVLIATIVGRLGGAAGPAAGPIVLDEPEGTRIAGVSSLPDRLTLMLQGAGPDRVVVVDIRSGRVLARASLAH